MWIRSDDIFMTRRPSGEREVVYDFKKFKSIHDKIIRSGRECKVAVIASEIDEHPEMVEYLQFEDGIDIEVHGWKHDQYGTWEVEKIVPELEKAIEKIERALGVRPEWMCPPWHQVGGGMVEACRKVGLKLNSSYQEIKRYTPEKVTDSLVFHYYDDEEVKILEKMLESGQL